MTPAFKNQSHLFLFLLCFYILILYSNTLQAPFILDDRVNIVERTNLHLSELTINNISKTFFKINDSGKKIYRPLSCLSIAINYYIGKFNVTGYHLVNIVIHLIVSILLFKVLLLLLELKKPNYNNLKRKQIAGLATILWAANPIQIQTVTYIIQRMASLSALFYILGIWSFLNLRILIKNGKQGRKKWFLITILSFSCAILSKPNAFLFPLGIFLVEFFFFDGISKKAFKTIGIASILSLILFLSIGPTINYEIILSGYDMRPFTLKQRLLTEPRILFYYLSQIFYPIPERFSISHSFNLSESFFSPFSTFISFVGIGLLFFFSFLKRNTFPFLGFAILFFFTHHLIESTIIATELVFEHRNYLPSFFLFLPVSYFLIGSLDKYKEHNKTIFYVIFLFCCLIVFFFGSSTYLRNKDWQTHESLWKSTVKHSPDLIRPYSQLGWYYTSSSRANPQKARQYFQLGLNKNELYSVFEKTFLWVNIARTYEQSNKFKAAKDAYLKSLKVFNIELNKKPLLVDKLYVKKLQSSLHYYLSNQYFSLNNYNKAMFHIDKALILQDRASFLNAKALYLMSRHDYKRANLLLKNSLQKNHNNWETYFLLGKNLTFLNNFSGGIWFFKLAIKKVDNSPSFHFIYLHMAENCYLSGDTVSGVHYINEFLKYSSVIDVKSYLLNRNKKSHEKLLFEVSDNTINRLNKIAFNITNNDE